jgi:hypothetical protein
MFKNAKPRSFAPPFETKANAYDAKSWLLKRWDARRAAIPFTPIQAFDLPLVETMTAPVVRTGAVDLRGQESELET